MIKGTAAMKNPLLRSCLTALLPFLFSLPLVSPSTAVAVEKPRVIVLTDIANEPDDEQSMVRFLVYSNEYDVEGLVATTSTWLRDTTRADLIHRQIAAYGEVRPNLLCHAEGFPEPGRLSGVVRAGQPAYGMEAVGNGRSTPGSGHIIEVVDRPDDRPVWICVWGGANTLAQALWDVKYWRTPEETGKFVAKLRVYTISDQDDSGRWMRITFPELHYIVSPSTQTHHEYHRGAWTGISGDRFFKNGPLNHYLEMVENPWLERNVIEGHGPLGALYPKVAYIMEGDTPSFLNLIDNGLGSRISPTYGGWGGRYELIRSYAETRPIYTNSRDTYTARDGSVHTTDQATIWRWREAFQNDFAARMDWSCRPDFNEANHNPTAVLNGVKGKSVVELTVKPGERVELSARGSGDPDGDDLTITWFQYREAGTYDGEIALSDREGLSTSFIAPAVNRPSTVHVILQLRDSGEPNLFSYRRAVITVRP